MDLLFLAYVNAGCCVLNVALYLGGGHQWWSASVAVLTGLVSLLGGMQATGRR